MRFAMIDQKIKILVSNHAVERLKERFYFRFKGYFANFQTTKNLIQAQVSTGLIMQDWKQSPFYVNKMATNYGDKTEIIKKSGVYFICSRNDNVLMVKTCVPKVLYYK